MSKIAVIREIALKLHDLGVASEGCETLDIKLPNGNNLAWVSESEVMISVKIGSNLYRNKRYPIYSKYVDIDLLNLINNSL